MKTFKKFLLSATILFNSCAIIAMNGQSVNEIMRELQETALSDDRLNEIKDILLSAFNGNCELLKKSSEYKLLSRIIKTGINTDSYFRTNISSIAEKCHNLNATKIERALRHILGPVKELFPAVMPRPRARNDWRHRGSPIDDDKFFRVTTKASADEENNNQESYSESNDNSSAEESNSPDSDSDITDSTPFFGDPE